MYVIGDAVEAREHVTMPVREWLCEPILEFFRFMDCCPRPLTA
jgi:hypothetical protein